MASTHGASRRRQAEPALPQCPRTSRCDARETTGARRRAGRRVRHTADRSPPSTGTWMPSLGSSRRRTRPERSLPNQIAGATGAVRRDRRRHDGSGCRKHSHSSVVRFATRQQSAGTRRVRKTEHARSRTGTHDTRQTLICRTNLVAADRVYAVDAPDFHGKEGSTVRVRQRALQKRRKPALSRFLIRFDLQTCWFAPFQSPLWSFKQRIGSRWCLGRARYWLVRSRHHRSLHAVRPRRGAAPYR